MSWKKITDIVKRHPLFDAVTELTAIIDAKSKSRYGPEAYAMCAGGAVSDMYANMIGTRTTPIQDIDIWVKHEDLSKLLEEIGLPAHPAWTQRYPDFLIYRSEWRGTLVHVIDTYDVAHSILEFDVADRLAWCDGRNCWLSDRATECLTNNLLDIHCFKTPAKTAVRINRFMRRYNATLADRVKVLLQKALGPTKADVRRAVHPYCKDEAEVDQVVSLWL